MKRQRKSDITKGLLPCPRCGTTTYTSELHQARWCPGCRTRWERKLDVCMRWVEK